MSDNFVRYGKSENLADQIYKFCERNNIKVIKNIENKKANYDYRMEFNECLSDELIESIIELVRKYDNL